MKIQISWDNTTETLSAHVVMARSGAPNGKEEAGFLQDMFFKNQHVRVRNPKESFITESELDTEKQATLYLTGDRDVHQATVEWMIQEAAKIEVRLVIDNDAKKYLGMNIKNYLSYAEIQQKTQNFLKDYFSLDKEALQRQWQKLTSPNAIAAYKTRNATIVDLIGLEVAKIRALTSVAALQLYQAKQVKATDFINLTVAEINSAIVDKLEQANLSRDLLDHPNEVCFKRSSNF